MANNKAIEGPNSQATAPRVKRARKVLSADSAFPRQHLQYTPIIMADTNYKLHVSYNI
jgi:hypothetical protein